MLMNISSKVRVTATSREALQTVFNDIGGAILKQHENGAFDISVTYAQHKALKESDVLLDNAV